MKPFLEYGWQPQVMSVDGQLQGDPRRAGWRCTISPPIPARRATFDASAALAPAGAHGARDYPVPSPEAARPPASARPTRRGSKLASLGYIGADAAPVVRKDAPRPVDMRRSSTLLDRRRASSRRAVRRGRCRCSRRSSPRIRTTSTPRCALATRALVARAGRAGARDVPEGRGARAGLAGRPHVPRAALRARQGLAARRAAARAGRRRVARSAAGARGAGRRPRAPGPLDDAIALRQRIYAPARRHAGRARRARPSWRWAPGRRRSRSRPSSGARAQQGAAFAHDLELGVLYLAARQFEEARDALDRVPPHRIPATRWRSSSARR